tara:strand:+ start:771 stop:1529 length:759 start_codon:yes stop_codon:yes gene_type:complete
MARFAAGKDAYGISDRSGFRYRLREMRKEWNGSLVGPDEYEPKHPQLEPIRAIPDAEALRNPRPDTSDDNIPFVVFTSTGKDIIPSSIKDLSVLTGSVGTVTITSTVASSSSTTISSNVGTSAVGSVEVYQLFAVTVVSGNPSNHPYYNVGSSNKYAIDGSTATSDVLLTLTEGSTFRFDQSDSSNSGHPLRFSETANGTHGGGTEYTTGVTTVGTPGSAGAYTQITVAVGAPTLYYYCTNHSAMGWQGNTP